MDRLTSLGVFVQVVDSGGFSAAARRLNMSTTMVSSHVQALEERLGARLLNRTTRRVSVTEVGRNYYERSSQILAELEEADRMAGLLQSTPRGKLRLFVGSHIVRFITPSMAEFLRLNPEASIEMTMGEQMPDLIEAGFDLAILATPPPDSTLIVKHLSGWRHVLCGAPAFFDAHKPPRTLRDLAGVNCLRYAYYPFGDEWRFTGPDGKLSSVKVAGNLVTNSGEALRLAALDGVGLFLAPSFLVADDLRSGELLRVLPEYRPVEFAINAIYPHRYQLSAKVRSFIDLVAQRLVVHREWMEPGTTSLSAR